ncbi:alpha/beta-hydrolase [Sarocladium strictum]
MSDSLLDRWWLAACLKLLNVYVIPKAKLQSYIAEWTGAPQPTLGHRVANASIRWLSAKLSTAQFRAMTTGFADPNIALTHCSMLLAKGAVCEHVKAKGFEGWYVPRMPDSTHVILYIHGGGFVSGSPETAGPYLLQLATELESRGTTADIFAVKYGLAPESPYPTGLGHVVAAYEHVRTLNKPIVLMGDSAGGNLCLGLLRHIQTPHPAIASSARPSSSGIIALCLTSPWVNLRNDSIAYVQNAGRDCLDKGALDRWRDVYLAQHSFDEYSNPLEGEDSWADVLPSHVFLISGELDMFVADIRKLAEQIREDDVKDLKVLVAANRGHVWNMVDFGPTQPGVPAKHADKQSRSAYDGLVLQADWIKNMIEASQ